MLDMNHAAESRNPDPFVELATQAVQAFVMSGYSMAVPASLPPSMRGQAGVFVSIKKHGQLRGCIGTFFPDTETLAHEIIANAEKSASLDPRFPPIHPSELADLTISVDVLTQPEACTAEELNPALYGVIVQSGSRRGLLLPDLEGVDTVEEQLAIAKSKAGIPSGDPCALLRFEVDRHS